MTREEQEVLAVRVSHMSKWFTDQSYEATTLREVVEALRVPAQGALEIARLREALQFIAEGYDNQDVNHVDYRVKVYQVATEALSKIVGSP